MLKLDVWFIRVICPFWCSIMVSEENILLKKPQGDMSCLMSISGLWGKHFIKKPQGHLSCILYPIYCRLGVWPVSCIQFIVDWEFGLCPVSNSGCSVFIFPLHIGLLFPGALAVLTWIPVFTFSVCMSVLWPMTYKLIPIYWGRYFKLLFV